MNIKKILFSVSLSALVVFGFMLTVAPTPAHADCSLAGNYADQAACVQDGGTWTNNPFTAGDNGGGNVGGITLTGAPYVECDGTGIRTTICQLQNLLNSIIPILMALGVVYFIWGVVQFMIAGGEEAKTKGRDTIIYGVIGLAVIVGLWGLVNIVINTFDLSSATAPVLTKLTGNSASDCDLSTGGAVTLKRLLGFGTCLVNDSIIPLIFALAVVYFVWGVVQYMFAGGEEAKTKGKDAIIYGVVALAVMISVWGLVKILAATFGLTDTSILPHVTPN